MLTPVAVPTTETARTDQKVYHEIQVLGRKCMVKRNLASSEYVVSPFTHKIITVPDLANRMRNERGAIEYVRAHTTIPVPEIVFYLDEGDRVYLATEMVDGVRMDDIENVEDRAKVIAQLDSFVEQLAALRSATIRGFAPQPCWPYAITSYRQIAAPLQFRVDHEKGYPLCHGDLHQANVIVDPDTMQVKAVLDWEHCGFYPPELDASRYKLDSDTVVHPDGSTTPYVEFGEKAARMLDQLRIDPFSRSAPLHPADQDDKDHTDV